MKFNNNEEAVSPVIGVILMVAITVILAAVIAVFVFGMTDDIQTTHTVSITTKVSDDNLVLTFQGGQDASAVSFINTTAYTDTGAVGTLTASVPSPSESTAVTIDNNVVSWKKPTVGQVLTITNGAKSPIERVVITGKFDDGATQVLIDKRI